MPADCPEPSLYLPVRGLISILTRPTEGWVSTVTSIRQQSCPATQPVTKIDGVEQAVTCGTLFAALWKQSSILNLSLE